MLLQFSDWQSVSMWGKIHLIRNMTKSDEMYVVCCLDTNLQVHSKFNRKGLHLF